MHEAAIPAGLLPFVKFFFETFVLLRARTARLLRLII